MKMTNLNTIKLINDIPGSGTDPLIEIYASGCEADYLDIRGSGWPLDSIGNEIYPSGSDVTISEMVGYKLSRRKSLGIESERLADYSYTTEYTQAGYPKSITGKIKKYLRMI